MCSIVDVKCKLLIGPVDTVCREGQTIQLNCSTDLSVPVNWDFINTTGHLRTVFGRIGIILPTFRARFNVTKKDGGFYNLIINNCSYSDAGRYRCIDDQGLGFGGWKNEDLWAEVNLVITSECCGHILLLRNRYYRCI